MPASPDILCQWCKKVVAVAITDAPGTWLSVAETVVFAEKQYCSGVSGDCWDNLVALTTYVKDNFRD